MAASTDNAQSYAKIKTTLAIELCKAWACERNTENVRLVIAIAIAIECVCINQPLPVPCVSIFQWIWTWKMINLSCCDKMIEATSTIYTYLYNYKCSTMNSHSFCMKQLDEIRIDFVCVLLYSIPLCIYMLIPYSVK